MRFDGTFDVSLADQIRLRALIEDPRTSRIAVQRAEIVLLAAKGCGLSEIRWRTGRHRDVVAQWQRRYQEAGVDGLLNGQPWLYGPPPSIVELRTRYAALINPDRFHEMKRWAQADTLDLAHFAASVVGLIWRAHGLRLRTPAQIKLSQDVLLVDKMRSIIGLYLNPPPDAVVVCVDEKSQIPASRQQHSSKLLAESSEFGYQTTTMFAALLVHEGRVIARCMQRQRHQELLRFMNYVDTQIPSGKRVCLIMDNFAPHLHPSFKRWLVRNPRFIVHYTPTCTSWLNAVEAVFATVSKSCLDLRNYESIIELQIAIKTFVVEMNLDRKCFPMPD